MKEIWRYVPGYERIYEVSSLGDIRRVGGWTDGRKIKIRGLRRPYRADNGYMRITLHRDRRKQRFPVHFLVMAAFVGPMPFGKQVNHKNGIRYDNRLDNLEYLTPSENQLYSFRTLGRKGMQGSKSPMSKVTETQVIAIREMRAKGHFLKDIGERFGLSPSTVCGITKGNAWKHVTF